MVKRKFDASDAAEDRCSKQLKLVPFPTYQPDLDIDMSDDSSSSPTESIFERAHMRLDSGASTSSASSDGFSYPSFNIYPEPFFHPDGRVNIDSHNFARLATPPPIDKSVGILQPRSSFTHNGNCTQIPKLRVACSANSSGTRTMWSHCEECGAIEMIDPDY